MGVWSMFFGKVLPVGIEIIFMGQPRRMGLLTGIDTNQEGKTALQVEFVGLKKGKLTGYHFDNHDFDPPLNALDIKSYAGLILCFKNIDGQDNFTSGILKQKNEEIIKTRRILDIYKKSNIDLLNVIESNKLSGKREFETIEGAKKLKALKDIVQEREIISMKKDSAPLNSMFSR